MYDTKFHFGKTFLKLLETHSIDEITISQLCEKSNYSRETFYYHFKDKYDLIRWIHYYQSTYYFEKFYPIEPWDSVIDRILHETIRTSIFYTRGFEDDSYNNLEKSMLEHTNHLYTEMVKDTLATDDLPNNFKILIKYNANGSVLLVKEWIMNDFKIPKSTFKEAIIASMSEDLKEVLVYKNTPEGKQRYTDQISTLEV